MDISGINLSGVDIIDKYRVPNAPIIGTATVVDYQTATVSFTAPSFDGNGPITTYTAVSSPGGITGTLSQSGSGTITVTGLTPDTAYTFTVYATNRFGNSESSSASNSITTPIVIGQAEWTSPITTTWTVPDGVFSISVLAVGGGGAGYWGSPPANTFNRGGGGGALAYVNGISVTPGEVLTITSGDRGINLTPGTAGTSGGYSDVQRANGTVLCRANGGTASTGSTAGPGGTVHTGTGGVGGNGSTTTVSGFGAGGGGAGGYSGKGGNGGSSGTFPSTPGNGVGGGGGGGAGYKITSGTTGAAAGGRGGGVGIYGEGTSGLGGVPTLSSAPPGNPGSGGSGETYGAGGGGSYNSVTGVGAVRIIYPGNLRYYPTTRTTNE